MESCFRFSILEFVFGIYLYFFAFQTVLMPKMKDRHCVNKMSVIVLSQPMDCQRAVYVHRGSEQVVKDAGWRAD